MIKGEILSFPLIIKKVNGLKREKITINNQDELVELFDIEIKKEFNSKKDMSQIIEEFGLSDTINLTDDRTISLLNNYLYYSSTATPAAPFDCTLWRYAVITFSNILQMRLF